MILQSIGLFLFMLIALYVIIHTVSHYIVENFSEEEIQDILTRLNRKINE